RYPVTNYTPGSYVPTSRTTVWQERVPVIKETWRIYFRCKCCGHVRTTLKTHQREDFSRRCPPSTGGRRRPCSPTACSGRRRLSRDLSFLTIGAKYIRVTSPGSSRSSPGGR